MSSKFEYETTYCDGLQYDVEGCLIDRPQKPEVPDGDGWVMTGMAANRSALFWAWKREVKDVK